jgi:RNA polymerase sigma-70 factor (ECF subfamily)
LNYKKQHIDLLLLACKKQDQKAQMELYLRYYKNTYHASFSILKNREDAMDAMQEAFITAFQHLDQYTGIGSFGGWLHKIAIRKSIAYYHQNKKLIPDDQLENKLEMSESQEEFENLFQELHPTALENALSQIHERYQLVLKLYYLEGYDHEEISEIMNWSSSNCRTTLSRARAQLKKQLNDKKTTSQSI